jgi:hypothetical protein
MAKVTDDQTLRIMYLKFGQLWRDAAQTQLEDDASAAIKTLAA